MAHWQFVGRRHGTKDPCLIKHAAQLYIGVE